MASLIKGDRVNKVRDRAAAFLVTFLISHFMIHFLFEAQNLSDTIDTMIDSRW